MDDRVRDAMKRIPQLLQSEDFDEVLTLLEGLLKDTSMDRSSTEYSRMLDVKIFTLKRLAQMDKDRKERHLREQKRCHRLVLENPYSYLDPHSRISSEYQIKHIDLELAGVPWDEEEVQEDA